MRPPQRPRAPAAVAALLLLAAALLGAARAAPAEAEGPVAPASLESLVPSGFAAAAAKAISAYSSVFKDARDRLEGGQVGAGLSDQAWQALASGTEKLQGTPLAGLISISVHEICPMIR
ncbi:hypothetical protein MNEG_5648 [Monoraphidium neglectum]|jgi:hypothetical protein|uniref:DUF732 domain-containing protein n=1 Tax=Monoraphidium neglectum TaxID=145388 RepID=A0A0D2MGW6_9CHLO|nr:hypothetical protein MNEG_5648 [Monoraphidium neglectum]KIZ02315.1 hypothetical protein MNEG_5648 [Monoraphidium neglectum]|eukprot:XP_013901334.1 hypothetical protein MNEG_5648 [Monoraphidium neglectum]